MSSISTRTEEVFLPDDPLQPHSHDPNLKPPSYDPAFRLILPGGSERPLTPDDLETLPQTAVPDCYIVSTGHGTSGPFTFGGVTLSALIDVYHHKPWQIAEIVSADDFGCRVLADEARPSQAKTPILLATHINGRPMTREEGLVRLIVPSEREDALRQVKWISVIRVR
jgi:hypothetical protein